jgi:hypothetical protein
MQSSVTVAQVSNLLYRRLPVGRACDLLRVAILETRDLSDILGCITLVADLWRSWEAIANFQSAALGKLQSLRVLERGEKITLQPLIRRACGLRQS